MKVIVEFREDALGNVAALTTSESGPSDTPKERAFGEAMYLAARAMVPLIAKGLGAKGTIPMNVKPENS